MTRTMPLRLAALVGAAALALAAGALPAAAQEKVTYLLPAPVLLPAFGPWHVAKQRGYYKAEGLDVSFEDGKGGVNVAKQIGAGNAVIGGAIGDTAMVVRAQGIPVRSVALLGGGSLIHIAVDEAGPIKSPADLKGKTITVISTADSGYYALLGVMAKFKLGKNDADIQAAGPSGVWQLFVQGKADAMAAVPDWTAIAMAQGKKVRIFRADEHFESMAQAIVASDETIKSKPETVRKLVRATLKGMADIMRDPDGAAKDFVAAVPAHQGKEGAIAATFKLYNQLVYPGQKTLGEMDEARIAKVQDFYVKEGLIPKASPVKDLYTNDFVK